MDSQDILEKADYQRTFHRQKTILWEKFQDQCVLAYNGGLFKITPEFISAIKSISESEQWVLDMNSRPVWIENIAIFHMEVYNRYYTSLAEYGKSYNYLKSQRSVKSLIDL